MIGRFGHQGGIRKAWFQTWPQWTTHCSHAERSPCWPTKHQVQIKHCVRLHCIIIWGAQRQSLMPFPGFCSSNTELMDLSAKFIPMFRYVCWLNYHVSSLPSYKARKNNGHSTMHTQIMFLGFPHQSSISFACVSQVKSTGGEQIHQHQALAFLHVCQG